MPKSHKNRNIFIGSNRKPIHKTQALKFYSFEFCANENKINSSNSLSFSVSFRSFLTQTHLCSDRIVVLSFFCRFLCDLSTPLFICILVVRFVLKFKFALPATLKAKRMPKSSSNWISSYWMNIKRLMTAFLLMTVKWELRIEKRIAKEPTSLINFDRIVSRMA